MARTPRPAGRHLIAAVAVVALTLGGAALPAQSLQPLGTIAVGNSPYGVAIAPNGEYGFVANRGSDSVSRIDLATNTVTATIPVPDEPARVAFVPDGSKAYVTSWVGNAVTVINTATNATTPVTGIPASPNAQPFDLAVTPDGAEVIVSGYASDARILTISTATNAVVNSVSSGQAYFQGIDLDPAGTTAYVASTGGALLFYDLATDTFDLTGTVTGLGWGNDVEVTPDGSEVWITNNAAVADDGSLFIYDVASGEIVLEFTGFDWPTGIAFSPDGSIAYVAEDALDAVTSFDFDSLDLLHEFDVDNGPSALAVSPDGRRFLTANYDADSASVAGTIQRIGGSGRYEVAVSIAQRAFPGTADTVFIASGQNYPDALSAGPVAAAENGPLLLTPPNELLPVVIDEIERLAPDQIYIVGGTGAVSEGVRAQLNAVLAGDDPVVRVGGLGRYETSRLVNEIAFPSASATVPVVYLSTGGNFPDALSTGAAGAALGIPVLLIDGAASSLEASVLELLDDWGTTSVKISGGTGAVSAQIEAQLTTLLGASNVERLAGLGRYDTSLEVNQDAYPSASIAYVATGENFPDALAGAALAGSEAGPLFVAPGTCVPQAMLDAFDAMGVGEVVLLGGEGVLTRDVFTLQPCP